MRIIDFHSHILPGIDDGSRNVETTREMLDRMTDDGVGCVIATPHFYASRDRVEHFLARRGQAYEVVMSYWQEGMPQIRLGAEVAFFPGVSRADKLDNLTVDGTKLLLLEMPFMPWEQSQVDEVRHIVENRGFHVILAHLERYMDISENRKKIQQLLELPLSVQMNAGSLLDWKKRGRLVRMFRDGKADFLGSDCHGINHRPPNLKQGRDVLAKKLGQEFLNKMDAAGSSLLHV